VNISNIGGKIGAWPIHAVRHGKRLTEMIGGYIKGVPGVIVCGDATASFKNVFGFLLQ
jgi:hypothetical protein